MCELFFFCRCQSPSSSSVDHTSVIKPTIQKKCYKWCRFFPDFPIKTRSAILSQNQFCGGTKKTTPKNKKRHRGWCCRPTSEWRSFIVKVVKSSWSLPDEKHLRRWARSSKTNDSAGSLLTRWCQVRTFCVLKKKSCSFMLLWACCFSFFPGRYRTGRKSQQLVTDPVNYHGDW